MCSRLIARLAVREVGETVNRCDKCVKAPRARTVARRVKISSLAKCRNAVANVKFPAATPDLNSAPYVR